LRDIYKGNLDPSMQDEEQYQICDSIINTRGLRTEGQVWHLSQ